MTTKSDFKCPKCKQKNRIKIVSNLDASQIDKIINRELFTHECKNCHEKYYVEYPLKVVGDNYVVYYTPGSNTPVDDNSKDILRICDTYDDLKEKLLILNDALNDIVIEFIKTYIKNNLDEKILESMNGIRYDGKNEHDLIFHLLGTKQSATCKIEVYEKLLTKFKFKKINKCVLIDEYTYTSYYKMRLL